MISSPLYTPQCDICGKDDHCNWSHYNFDEKLQNYFSYYVVKQLCHRPAMYVGRAKLDLVITYLRGFFHAWSEARPEDVPRALFENFENWIGDKFQINHPGWDSEKILFHVYNHDEQTAIKKIDQLFEECLDNKLKNFKKVSQAPNGAPTCNICNENTI